MRYYNDGNKKINGEREIVGPSGGKKIGRPLLEHKITPGMIGIDVVSVGGSKGAVDSYKNAKG